MPRPRCGKRVLSRTADWEGFTAESERSFAEPPLLTSCSAGEKVFRWILGDAGRRPYPLRLCQGLLQPSPRCRATSHLRERSEAHWAPPAPSWWAWPDLPDGVLQPLISCWSSHPGNLEELRHNPDIESREPQRIPPHLSALPEVKILEQLYKIKKIMENQDYSGSLESML